MPDRKIWVLVIEDSSPSRMLIANQLHKKGFEVICAEDGEQAMEIIKYCTPDCIILDIIMPKMHGHAFLSWLRERTQSLPVIVMSAIENQPDLVATIKKLGIAGWISKPINPIEITKRIMKAVEPDSETSEANSDATASTNHEPKEESKKE